MIIDIFLFENNEITLFPCFTLISKSGIYTERNGFVTATKLGTTNKFFVAETKNFAAVSKSLVDKTKHFVVVTKYFCYPYFNK